MNTYRKLPGSFSLQSQNFSDICRQTSKLLFSPKICPLDLKSASISPLRPPQDVWKFTPVLFWAAALFSPH